MPLEHVDLSEQVIHRSLADLARERILQDILQHRLMPGEMVQLKSLAEAYGISRTPVREALTRLQQSGLVESVPYKGYRIRPLETGDVEDVIFVRGLLEPVAAERAATRISEEQLAELSAIRPPDSEQLDLEFDRYSERFHLLVGAASGSRRLEEMVGAIYSDVRRLQSAGLSRSVPKDIVAEHEEILQALKDRDPERARDAMSRHVLLVHAKALSDLAVEGAPAS